MRTSTPPALKAFLGNLPVAARCWKAVNLAQAQGRTSQVVSSATTVVLRRVSTVPLRLCLRSFRPRKTVVGLRSGSGGQGAFGLAVGDFKGNGISDLAVIEGVSFGVLLGNGDGTFQAAVNYTTGFAGSVAVGDFNGDGIRDVYWVLWTVELLILDIARMCPGSSSSTMNSVVSDRCHPGTRGAMPCFRGQHVLDESTWLRRAAKAWQPLPFASQS
jgi:hypothetical protein